MTIGERIQMLRVQNGFTREYLAGIVGMAQQNIYKYEKGIITNIPIENVEKLAKALGVSPVYLAGWESESGDSDLIAEVAQKLGPEKLRQILQALSDR